VLETRPGPTCLGGGSTPKAVVGFGYGMACVILGIGLIVRAVIGDPLDYYFGVIAAGERAFRVRPIAFGLAFVVAGEFFARVLGIRPKCRGASGESSSIVKSRSV